MRICILASGSKGNCAVVESAGEAVVLDAGLSWRAFRSRLADAWPEARDFKWRGVVVSHSHNDHAKHALYLAANLGAPVVSTLGTWKLLEEREAQEHRVCKPPAWVNWLGPEELGGNAFVIPGGLLVKRVETEHDADESAAFLIDDRGLCACLLTDLAWFSAETDAAVRESSWVGIECNHSVRMLEQSDYYPRSVKERIIATHLSNRQAAENLVRIGPEKMKTLVLLHLSTHSNDPVLACAVMRKLLDGRCPDDVVAASQDEPIGPFEVTQ